MGAVQQARRALGRMLPRGRFLRRLTMLSGSFALGQVIVLASSPILTRLFSPEDFGIYAVFTALSGLLGAVLALRYEIAVPLAASEPEAANMAGVTLLLTAIGTLLCVPLVWYASDWLAAVTGMPALTKVLWLLPLTMALNGLAQFLNYWSVYRGTFRLNASSRVLQSLVQSVLQVVLGWLGSGPAGLVGGYGIAYGARAVNFAIRLPAADWRLLLSARLRPMLQLAVRHWRYPAFSAPSTLLQSCTQLLPAILLATLYGPAVAGWYGLGQRLIGLPVRLLGQAASQVFLGEMAQSSSREAFRLFRKASLTFFLLGLVIMAPLIVAGPQLFSVIFGEEWRTAGEITRLLVPLYLTRFVVTPISQTLNVYGKQSLHLLSSGLDATLLAASFVSAWTFELEPLTTVLLFSLGSSFAFLLYFWFAYRAARGVKPGRDGTLTVPPADRFVE